MNGRVAVVFGCLHFLSAVYGVIIEPRPTADVKENDNLTLTCRQVDAGWTSILFSDETTNSNIGFIIMQNGNCKDFAGIYTVKCHVSLQEIYLTITYITVARYHGHNILCGWDNGTFSTQSFTTINVQFPPTSLPNISQTPSGPIIEGSFVNLTCDVIGGNPKAIVSWSCDYGIIITPLVRLGNTATSSVTVTVSKEHNGKSCTCEGQHLFWINPKLSKHSFMIYYHIDETVRKPGNTVGTQWNADGVLRIKHSGDFSNIALRVRRKTKYDLSQPKTRCFHLDAPYSTFIITQTPPGPMNATTVVILTCEIYGGNPTATIIWRCEGSTATEITPTGSPSTNKSLSSMQLTVTKEDNGRVCTCTGSHPVWVTNKTSIYFLHVQYMEMLTPEVPHVRPEAKPNRVHGC